MAFFRFFLLTSVRLDPEAPKIRTCSLAPFFVLFFNLSFASHSITKLIWSSLQLFSNRALDFGFYFASDRSNFLSFTCLQTSWRCFDSLWTPGSNSAFLRKSLSCNKHRTRFTTIFSNSQSTKRVALDPIFGKIQFDPFLPPRTHSSSSYLSHTWMKFELFTYFNSLPGSGVRKPFSSLICARTTEICTHCSAQNLRAMCLSESPRFNS